MSTENFDIIVIGGGPGGYVAAIRSAQLGFKTALVEAQHLGGICLNWGCIPTKALLRSSEIYTLAKHADEFGLEISGLKYNINKVVERSRAVASRLSMGVKHLLKKNKVQVIEGFGSLSASNTVLVDKKPYSAKHIILATGARARELPGIEPDGEFIWSYKEAMVPKAMPKSILVVGSGAIGIEFASFYNALGVEVCVVEIMDRILPVEDEEISALALKSFKKQGMEILTGAKVVGTKKAKNKITVDIELSGSKASDKSKTLSKTVDKVISAVGIVGNTENIGLENTKVKVDRSHIITNEWCETAEKNIYAIGDVTGPPWLAHKASHEAILCVEKIAGIPSAHPLNKSNIPGCTYCMPQVASIGLTEAQAKEAGYKLKVGKFPFQGNGKAIALGEDEGLIKTIFDEKTGELLGAHMIGAEVTELIQGYSIAKTLETTEAELMQTVFPHPTLSEMMHESVLDAYGKVIHM